ncbi:MAG TPA: mannose-6-phosphate isomerase, class I [Flavitalea sp.]|nr:mannose-6-phosphate isomerase, class I [Flavitalea sp.]
MNKIFRLEGIVQHYNWGGNAFIPQLLGKNNTEGKPYAEYWMGAHINAPAWIAHVDQRVPLNDFIKREPVSTLGEAVSVKFGNLPYLLKVLDVKDMLSIQVHPDKQTASREFEAENKKGMAVNAPDRNYKDANHKPELMAALSEFWLLHGFKPVQQLKKTLGEIPELQYLITIFNNGGYEGLYRHVMQLGQSEVNAQLQPLLDRISFAYENGKLSRNQEDFWAARAGRLYTNNGNIDRGLYSIYLFNVVHLKPGQAIFQDAGVPHAYLEGQNMEIMANSDNVLRAGLTSKHIDVEELIRNTKFEATIPNKIEGRKRAGSPEEIYDTPAADFCLSRIIMKESQQFTFDALSVDIYFVLQGEAEITGNDEPIHIKQGESFLAIIGAHPVIRALTDIVCFRASVPQSQ